MTAADGPEDRSLFLVAPELRQALDMYKAMGLDPRALAAMRDPAQRGGGSMRQPPPLSPAQQAVACAEIAVPGLHGAPDVRCLLYTPPDGPDGPDGLRPAFLHMHGGGYVLGTPEINDASNRRIAATLGCLILSVDYRLAPETVWPGALDDCHAALVWLHGAAPRLGIDPMRIAIGGDSAGGGHAAALAIRARDAGGLPICLQLLDAPMLDDRTGSGSPLHPWCGEFVWTPEHNRFGWGALLGRAPGGDDVPDVAVPARVADLTGLPPTFLMVGALDLFLEEGLDYVRRLARAGVPVELHVIPGTFHGFGLAGDAAPQVAQATAWRDAALARAFTI